MAEHLQVDLLRQRREELGLSPKPLVSPRQLLTKGAAYGLVPLAVVLLVGAGLFWRQQQLQASVLELQPDANLHDSLLQGNIKLQGQVLKLNQANKSLVDGLLAVRSSSAFLTALAALTPQGVQLQTARADSGTFSLKGQAQAPAAFERINILQLAMAESLFFKKPVRLKKAQQEQASSAKEQIEVVGFELIADFDNSKAQKGFPLQQLGALGMAARVEAIKQLGLLP